MKLHILNRHTPKHVKKHYNGKEVLIGFTAAPTVNKDGAHQVTKK